MKIRKTAIVATLTRILLIGCVAGCAGCREYSRWTEVVALDPSTTSTVTVKHSARFGMRWYSGYYGGGDDRYKIDVPVGDRHYRWQGGDERPFVLRLREGRLYMVVFDREEYSHYRYRYYRSDDENRLQEITPSEFPKDLAIQNMWLNDESTALLAKMDPEKFLFRWSLTARMWLHLETGADFGSYQKPSAEFAADFKARYICPHESPPP
ncbi:MAG: hypothetical protein FWE88_02530 [Phycisphaerae bacterium]|nr:hypothetical protein [Phycisphaerae bacterium]